MGQKGDRSLGNGHGGRGYEVYKRREDQKEEGTSWSELDGKGTESVGKCRNRIREAGRSMEEENQPNLGRFPANSYV